ncbi:putative effector protein [Blumeria hordei DH14]|uniref:Putative effector protein n=1 Tax=Blumeria graminis f. sp. hordei (strain DH14) TaxID=546991 RepID=N1JHL5_BLUG1|nr:putative effector protein [Blumeria hordei DH14]
MPPVRKKLPNAMLDNARVRPRAPAKTPGLAQKLSSMFASEAFIKGKSPNLPDKEMTDSEPVRSAKIGPETHTPIELAPETSTSRKGKEVVREKTTEHAETSARKFAVPSSKGTASTSEPEYPPELQSVMEAEKRRTTQITARLAICSTAISSVEAALSPLSIGDNKEFVDGIKVYLRAAIGQFVQSGPGSTPPVLPARPANPLSPRAPEIRVPNPTKIQAPAPKTTWATVARAGLVSSAGPSTKKAVPPAQKAKGANTRTAADTRLFLRLARNHPHRLLAPAGVRSAVSEALGTAANDITLVQRVQTGFALTAKNELARKELLDSSTSRSVSGIKLEPASNLVAMQIATVPETIRTLDGPIAVTAKMVADEVTRVTKLVPFLVRPHGTCKPGAPYQNWQALFPRESTPRPGFRLFDDSGAAKLFQPRRKIVHCNRCLGFHASRGCSRAPACWNCGSKMHSEAECKAPTRCRNCGGPHRSDSRSCRARPNKSGPVKKEQLAIIRKLEQKNHADYARIKAAAEKTIEEIYGAKNDVCMSDGSGFGILDSEEEV